MMALMVQLMTVLRKKNFFSSVTSSLLSSYLFDPETNTNDCTKRQRILSTLKSQMQSNALLRWFPRWTHQVNGLDHSMSHPWLSGSLRFVFIKATHEAMSDINLNFHVGMPINAKDIHVAHLAHPKRPILGRK